MVKRSLLFLFQIYGPLLKFKEGVVDFGDFLRPILAKNNFFSNFFFLKRGSKGSVLEALGALLKFFFEFFFARAPQSWQKPSFFKTEIDIFLTFFEIFIFILQEPQPFSRCTWIYFFKSIRYFGMAD